MKNSTQVLRAVTATKKVATKKATTKKPAKKSESVILKYIPAEVKLKEE